MKSNIISHIVVFLLKRGGAVKTTKGPDLLGSADFRDASPELTAP